MGIIIMRYITTQTWVYIIFFLCAKIIWLFRPVVLSKKKIAHVNYTGNNYRFKIESCKCMHMVEFLVSINLSTICMDLTKMHTYLFIQWLFKRHPITKESNTCHLNDKFSVTVIIFVFIFIEIMKIVYDYDSNNLMILLIYSYH